MVERRQRVKHIIKMPGSAQASGYSSPGTSEGDCIAKSGSAAKGRIRGLFSSPSKQPDTEDALPSLISNQNMDTQASVAEEVDLPILPIAPPSPRPSLSRATSSSSSHRTVRTRVESFADPNSGPDPASSSFPQRHLVDNLQKFCKYSSAAYGQVGIFSSKLT